MYSNIFDTVRTNDLDLINFEGLLYSSILSGLHPALSLNQAVDSKALLSIARQEEFLRLMENGYVKVALFDKYSGKEDGIYSFLNDKLSECISKEKASFKFSSLSFLYSGNYSEKQLLSLYKAMRDMLNGEYNGITSYKKKELGLEPGLDDAGKIEEYIETIKKISGAVRGKYILPPENGNKIELYKKVKESIKIYKREEPPEEIRECLENLEQALKRQRKLEKQKESKVKTNSRSYIYEVIETLGCTANQEEELKYMVDLCYNETVAASIADDEEDIIINNRNYQYAQVYSNYGTQENELDKCEQKLSLVNQSRNISSRLERSVLSWELLSEILKEAEPDKHNLSRWYEDMQKYCEKQGIKNIELGAKKLLSGSVSFSVTVVANIVLAKLLHNAYDVESVISLVHAGFLEAVIKDTSPQIVANLFSWSKPKEIEQEREKVRNRQNLVKECLTQTALLKKDYCCENQKAEIEYENK